MDSQELKRRMLLVLEERGINPSRFNDYLTQFENAIRYEQKEACYNNYRKMFPDIEESRLKRVIYH